MVDAGGLSLSTQAINLIFSPLRTARNYGIDAVRRDADTGQLAAQRCEQRYLPFRQMML